MEVVSNKSIEIARELKTGGWTPWCSWRRVICSYVTALCIWNIYYICDLLPLLWFCAQLNLTSTGIPLLGKKQTVLQLLLLNTSELDLHISILWGKLLGLHPKSLLSYEGPGPVKSETQTGGSRQAQLPRNWLSWIKLHSAMTLFADSPFKFHYMCSESIRWLGA